MATEQAESAAGRRAEPGHTPLRLARTLHKALGRHLGRMDEGRYASALAAHVALTELMELTARAHRAVGATADQVREAERLAQKVEDLASGR